MKIRRAVREDIPGLDRLLYQVHKVHSDGRPDIFIPEAKKYTDEELEVLLQDDETPVYVAVDENNTVLGYAFLIYQYQRAKSMVNMKSIYIDDLCVDEACRGQHVGTKLYDYVLEVAKANGCAKVTLNVWEFNETARKFYEHVGLVPLKTTMEKVL